MKIITFIFLSLVSCATTARPCEGIDLSLNQDLKDSLIPIISKKLHVESTEILQSYGYLDWHVIHIKSYGNNKGFLYFHDNSMYNTYLAVWGGGANNEALEIKKIILSNAKIISSKLVRCIEHVASNSTLSTCQPHLALRLGAIA